MRLESLPFPVSCAGICSLPNPPLQRVCGSDMVIGVVSGVVITIVPIVGVVDL